MSDDFLTNEKRLAKYRDDAAHDIVDALTNEEVERRQYCIEVISTSMNLDVTIKNLFELADRVYEYVWGKRQP